MFYASESDAASLPWAKITYLAGSLIPAAFLHFSFVFPTDQRTHSRFSYLAVYLPNLLILILLFFTSSLVKKVVYVNDAKGFLYGPLRILWELQFHMIFAFAFYRFARSYMASSSLTKIRLKYVILGTLVGLALASPTNVIMPRFNRFEFLWLGPPLTLTGVAFIVYAITRYRFMDINLAITRTTVFTVVYALALGLPLLIALSLQTKLERFLGTHWWVWLWVACAFLATVAHYANLYLQRRAEDRLLSEQRRYQTVLRQAAQGMTLIKEMDKLLNLIVHILTRSVGITHAEVYLIDKETQQYVLRARRGTRGQDVGHTIPKNAPLIKELINQKGSMVQEELKLELQGGGGTIYLYAVEQAMSAVDAAVIVPSFVEEQLLGFLLLGEKRSGKMYSEDDLQVFEVLASQAALAVENAQFYDELQRTQADLFQTAKMATLGQMAGGMSHQINNRFYVLTILAGTMKAALAAAGWDGVSPELKELVEKSKVTFQKIEDNAIRGGDIVKTLLRFSRPSRGDQKPVSVQEIVETALDVVQYKIKLEDLDFSKDYEPDLPLIQGNVNQLADSLFNLFSNAYDAIQSKQERLKPPDFRGSIAVTVRTVQGRVQLTIRDNGIGMSPQEVSQLFIPFFTTKATSEKGTGLGLFVIKRIVEHHGGQIQATSQFGEGTAFIITLPAAQQAQAVA